jgi:xanthine dehydrogenase accessory factor
MNLKKIRLPVCLIVATLLINLPLFSGCEKKSGTTDLPEANKGATAEIEQTVCPVMGGTIKKEIFTEYGSKKVYFCCPPCKTDFEKDPEKYIAKLPQFK